MTAREAFKASLPKYMRQAGMKQRDLAKAVDVSESTVHCWMSGKAFPRIDMIEKIAEVLNCSPDDLMEDPTPNTSNGHMRFGTYESSFDHPIIVGMLNSHINQTPQEDAKMATLWRNASLAAKRAAIAVLEAMKEENLK